MLEKEEFFRYSNPEDGAKRLDFGRSKVVYTMMEGLKVLEIGFNNSGSSRGVSFWLEVERSGVIPKRSAESMRTFFKNNSVIGVNEYMKKALESNAKFCHAFNRIPKVGSNKAIKS